MERKKEERIPGGFRVGVEGGGLRLSSENLMCPVTVARRAVPGEARVREVDRQRRE